MNLVTTSVATGVIVYAGTIAKEKPMTIKIAVGAGAFAIGLTLLSNMDQVLAERFAVLVLVAACYLYLPAIGKKTGLIK